MGRRRTGFRITVSLFCVATLGVATAAPQPAGPALPPRTHGFMLYLSQPIGGGVATGGPKFGFRLEQVRLTGNTGAPDAGNPMQHRALVGWEFGGFKASDMRLELGGRVTYDVTHGGFALQSSRAPKRASSGPSGAFNFALPSSRPLDEPAPQLHGSPEPALARAAMTGVDMADSTSRAATTADSSVHLACCVARFVRGEEHVNGGELNGLARAAHRGVRPELR